MRKPAGRPKKRLPLEVGWREHVGLPGLGVGCIQAKLDTGARTSALHAIDVETFERDEEDWVSFVIPVSGLRSPVRCKARIIDRRAIKNTSGTPENRFVIRSPLVIGRRHWMVEVSLADRGNMEFDLILGRTAMRRHNLVVNPGRSFIAGEPHTDPELPGILRKRERKRLRRSQGNSKIPLEG